MGSLDPRGPLNLFGHDECWEDLVVHEYTGRWLIVNYAQFI